MSVSIKFLLIVPIFLFEKHLLKSFAHLLISLILFWLCILCVPYLWLDIDPLADIWLVNIFSHSVGCCRLLTILLSVPLVVLKCFSLLSSHLIIFGFVFVALVSHPWNHCH